MCRGVSGSSKEDDELDVENHLKRRRSQLLSYSPAEECLRRQTGDFYRTPPGDLSQTNTTPPQFDRHNHHQQKQQQQQQQRLIRCKHCPFSTKVRVSAVVVKINKKRSRKMRLPIFAKIHVTLLPFCAVTS